MNKHDVKKAFDNITPSEKAKERMYRNITTGSKKETRFSRLSYRILVPALSAILILAGGIYTFQLINSSNQGANPPIESIGRDAVTDDIREDHIAPIQNQFVMGERHYIIVRPEEKLEHQLPETITENDVGDKISTIATSVDESLIGKDIFQVDFARGEEYVAVQRNDDTYDLFRFYSFERYLNNEDEDARAYLDVYGIHEASDIAKIHFIQYTEDAKLRSELNIVAEIEDEETIQEFYNYYSVLEDASDRYFKALSNGFYDHGETPRTEEPGTPPDFSDRELEAHDKVDIPSQGVDLPSSGDLPEDLPATVENSNSGGGIDPDAPSDSIIDQGDTTTSDRTVNSDGGTTSSGEGKSMPGYEGTGAHALATPLNIRIYNQSGHYFETAYYPNIKFLSRYEVHDEFSQWLESYMN